MCWPNHLSGWLYACSLGTMYILPSWKKEDPVVRWNLPDRIFFGHGACHILAGVFLQEDINPCFTPLWIKPDKHPGMHVFVSDGEIAFDYHGYSVLDRLQKHHQKVWRHQYSDWAAKLVPVDFDLLAVSELNQRNMRGPDQYFGDPIQRARRFIHRTNHQAAEEQARRLVDRTRSCRNRFSE